ncbi:MAG: PrsW family intramembrane metalloprotease [Treponema sp.]|nr:PrsW family intramembrane metalloprotease [Treponema sp.]
MNVYAPIILCFVPFVTMFALFKILVPGFSAIKGLVASLAGLLALIPITIVQFAVPGMRLFGRSGAISIILYSIVFLGLVEECFKALLLFIVGAKEEKLSHWFCYSLLAGLIFGSFESVIYFLLDMQNIGHGVTLNLIYLRMITAVLIHTLCAGLGGFTVYYCKNLRWNVWPLLNAVLIHGLYDYFVSFDTNVKFFCAIVILSAAIKCRVCYMQILEETRSKKSAKRTIIDPNKTVEMPKTPAIIIPVNNTVRESVDAEDVADEDSVDFDQIEREAKSQLKAAKKAAAKKTAAKKTESKTKKRAAPSASKKTASKSSAKTKTAAKPKTGATKTASKTKTAAAKKPAKATKPATPSKPKKGAASKKPASKSKGKK